MLTMAEEAKISFALAPGLVDDSEVLDCSMTDGKKLCKSAATALPNLFDCEQPNLTLFLDEIEMRAEECSWAAILTAPENQADADAPTHNITKECGLVSLQQVQSHAKSHIGQETRLAQDDAQLFHCLMASLTAEGKSKILPQRSDWRVKDDDGFIHKSGIVLLKVIVRESHIDDVERCSLKGRAREDRSKSLAKVRISLYNQDLYEPTTFEATIIHAPYG